MQVMPYTCRLPIAQPSSACHAAAKAQRLGKSFPGDTCAPYEEDAVERLLLLKRDPRPCGMASLQAAMAITSRTALR